MINIKLKQVSSDCKLYKNTDLKIEEGMTAIIGPNGSGKTYCISQLHKKFKHSLLIDVYRIDSERNVSTLDMSTKQIVRYIQSSEGQRVYNILEEYAYKIGRYITKCKKENHDAIILIDGVDSGVSIDLILESKKFFDLILEDCKSSDIKCYIIVTANNFAMVEDMKCIWIKDLSEHYFDSIRGDAYHMFKHLYISE